MKRTLKAKPKRPSIQQPSFESVFNHLQDAVAVGQQGAHLFCNPAYATLFGFDNPAELVGTSIYDRIAPSERERVRNYAEARLKGGAAPAMYETRGLRRDGSEFDMEVRPSRYVHEGEPHTLAILRDITERKRTERELRFNEELNRRILQCVPGGVVLASREGKILQANAEAQRILGLSYDAMTKMYVNDWNPTTIQEDGSPFEAKDYPVSRCLATGEPQPPVTIGVKRPDGAISWGIFSAMPLMDTATQQQNGAVVTFIDITQRKLDEQAHRESEERYRAFMAQSSEGIWRFEIKQPLSLDMSEEEFIQRCYDHGYLAECNDAMAKMYGFEKAAEIEGAKLSDLLVRSDPKNVEFLASLHRSGGRITNAESHEIDRHGQDKFFLNNIVAIFENGRISRVWGTQRDITLRKKAETALRESEERYRSALIAIHEAVIVVDEAGIMRACNPSCQRMFGLKPEEMLGFSVVNADWKSIREDGSVFPHDEYPALRCLREGKSLTGVVMGLYNPRGALIWIAMNAEPIFRAGDQRAHGAVVSINDITHRKRAESALRESEKRLEAIISNTPNVAVEGYDIEGRVLYWNKAAERIFGFTAGEAIGKTLDQLILDKNATGKFGEVLRTLDETGQSPRPTEWTFKARNGREGNLYSTIFPISSGAASRKEFICMDVDITQLKTAERELALSLSLVQATLESTADGILVVDSNGKIDNFNRKFAEMWRIPPAVLELGDDDKALQFVLDQLVDADSFLKKVRELYSQPDAASFDVLQFKDGRVFERYSQPQKIAGSFVGRVWSFRDITARVLAERERMALERKLLETQKLESLGVLAGGIAHDFNNLLAAVLGNVSLASMQVPPDSPARPFLASIETTTLRAAELCKQMLAYSGKGRFVVQPVALNTLIQEMADLLRISITKKTTLTFNLSPSLPPVAADATQLRQVVMNLILNASEAIGNEKPGVIGLTTGLCNIDHAALTETYLAPDLPAGDYLFVEVADSGCGMDAATKARIFDPFFTTKFTGRGLGLAAVLGIVRGHRGAIRVDSVPGQGTTFRILLPVGSASAASHEAVPKMAGRLLVVDDDETLRLLQMRMIQSVGLAATPAANGQEALELFIAQPQAYSAVLLDLSMPGMSGEEVCLQMQKLRRDIPVLLMSGMEQGEIIQRCSAGGNVRFLQKPFTPEDLARQIGMLLRKS